MSCIHRILGARNKVNCSNIGQKINKSIVFTEIINLSKIMHGVSKTAESEDIYELYGILVHYGNSPYAGHYTSFVKVNGNWYLFDDEEVTQLPNISVVLKQNPYILFYKRKTPLRLDESISELKKVVIEKKNTHNKKNTKQQQEQQTPQQSIQEKDTQEVTLPAKYRPNHQIFYRSDEEIISNLIIKVSLPNEKPESLVVFVNSNGRFSLDSKTPIGPDLNFNCGFKFLPPQCQATFYEGDQVLLILLCVIADTDTEEASEIPIQISPESSSVVSLDLDQEIELEIENTFQSSTSEGPSQVSKKSTITKALEKIERLNLTKSEAEYKNLYNEISKAWEIHNASKPTVLSNTSQTKNTNSNTNRVGRNDKCPCGSGRKYKQCHGAAK